MKSIIKMLLLICCVASINSLQAQITASRDLKLVAEGPVQLVFHNSGFTSDGSFEPGNSTLVFTGATPGAVLGGNKPLQLHNLVINKATHALELATNLQLTGTLTMQQGNFLLNNYVLDLGYTGNIMGESNESRITARAGGYIRAMADLHAPAAVNPGNIGVEISSAARLGITEIRRGHTTYVTDGETTIGRYYEILPQNNANLHATLRFFYLDAELDNNREQALSLLMNSHIKSGWTIAGKDASDQQSNWVLKKELGQLHRFTLAATANNPVAASLQLFPNPTPGNVTLQINSPEAKETTLQLYDHLGRLLESKKVRCHLGANTFSWDISKYPAGTYHVAIASELAKSIKLIRL